MDAMHKNGLRAYLVFSLALIVYIVLRAYYACVAHDELATFYFYIQRGEFLPFHAHWDANNHILNSGLSILFYKLFGTHVFVFRLASLLFLPVFLFFHFLIAKRIENVYLRYSFLFLLPLVHHFLEFYGASRGYGMSFSLIWMSVYFVVRFYENRHIYFVPIALLSASLALLANLALLNSMIILLALLLFVFFDRFRQFNLQQKGVLFISFLLTGLLPLLFYINLSLTMKEKGLLYYGELDGFWTLSIRSLLRLLVDESSLTAQLAAALLMALATVLFVGHWFRAKFLDMFRNKKMLFPFLFFGNVAAVLLMAEILGVNYPEDRVALYLFLFFVPAVFFLLDAVSVKKFKYYAIPFLLVFMFFPFHFLGSMNLSFLYHYRTDAYPKRFYEEVKSWSDSTGQLATVGGYRQREMVWGFYDYAHGGDQNALYWADYPGTLTDFQIIRPDSLKNWERYYDSIDSFAPSGYYLLKRKQMAGRELIMENHPEDQLKTKRQYFSLLSIQLPDSLKGQDLYAEVDASLTAEPVPFLAWMVMDVSDKDGDNLRYERNMLHWKRLSWDGNKRLKLGMVLHDVPAESRKIIVYLWNIRQQQYSIENTSLKLYRLHTEIH